MKLFFYSTLVIASTHVTSFAFSQNNQPTDTSGSPSLGFELVKFQDDFGFGLQMTSPYFFSNTLGLQVSVAQNYFTDYVSPTTGHNRWEHYQTGRVGIVGGRIVSDLFRLYSYAGALIVRPGNKLSSKDLFLGGYAKFGFEFLSAKSQSLFLEYGLTATNAVAEKISTKPIFVNGHYSAAGIRVYL